MSAGCIFWKAFFFLKRIIDNILVSNISFLMFNAKITCNDYSGNVFLNSFPTASPFILMHQFLLCYYQTAYAVWGL